MRKLIIVTALLSLVLPTAVHAAGAKCGDRTKLIKSLTDKYKEEPRAIGLSASGKAVFEIYTSKTGTWTIVMSTTTGAACIMAAGDSWEEIITAVGNPL